MTYVISGSNTRAGLRGGGPLGAYGVMGLGSARSDYDTKADGMRAAAKMSPFPVPVNMLEASIVAALGPRPAKAASAAVDPRVAAIAAAKVKIAAKLAACAAKGGTFTNGACVLPGDDIAFGKESVDAEGGSNTMLIAGAAAVALIAFVALRK